MASELTPKDGSSRKVRETHRLTISTRNKKSRGLAAFDIKRLLSDRTSFDIQNTLRNFVGEKQNKQKETGEIPKRERPLKKKKGQVDCWKWSKSLERKRR